MEGVQDIQGRLWDVLWMFRQAARQTNGADLRFELIVQHPETEDWQPNERVFKEHGRTPNGMQRLTSLKALCHPGDDFEPVITIMQPDED